MKDKPSPADFSQGTMRQLFVEAMPLLSEARLDSSRLLDLAGDTVIRGRELKELLAKASMQIDDILGSQRETKAARLWMLRTRMKQLLINKKKLEQKLNEVNEERETRELRNELLKLSQDYAHLKEQYNTEF